MMPGLSGVEVVTTVTPLETAGLVQLRADGPGGLQVALTLTPREADELAERLMTAAHEVTDA